MPKKSGKKGLPKKIGARKVSGKPFAERDLRKIVKVIERTRHSLIPFKDTIEIIRGSMVNPAMNYNLKQQVRIAEDTAKLMSHITVPLEATKPTIDSLTYFASSMESFAKVTEQLSQSTEQITRINKVFGSFTIPLASSYSQIIKTLNESTAFLYDEEFKSFEFNWVDFISFTDLKELYKLYREGNEKGVKDYFYSLFNDPENVDILVKKFSNNSHFQPRIKIIKDALSAHVEGRYSLSIPVIWTQIDGIFIKSHKDIMEGKNKGKCEKCGNEYPISPTARHIVKEIIKERELSGMVTPFEEQYFSFIEESYLKKRSKILHGLDTNYPDRDVSTKLILALYQLYNYLEESKVAS